MFSLDKRSNDPVDTYVAVADEIRSHLALHPSDAASSMEKGLKQFENNMLLAAVGGLQSDREADADFREMTALLTEVLLGMKDVANIKTPMVDKESYQEPKAVKDVTDTAKNIDESREKRDDENDELWQKEINILNRKMFCRYLSYFFVGMAIILKATNSIVDLKIDKHTNERVMLLLVISGALLHYYSLNAQSQYMLRGAQAGARQLAASSAVTFLGAEIAALTILGLKDAGFFVKNPTISPASMYEVGQKLASKLISEVEHNSPEEVKAVFRQYLQEHPTYDMKKLDVEKFLNIMIKADGKIYNGLNVKASLPVDCDLKKIAALLISEQTNSVLNQPVISRDGFLGSNGAELRQRTTAVSSPTYS